MIAWSEFSYSIVDQFGIAFVAVTGWNLFDPWPAKWGCWYFSITLVVIAILVRVISTIWFMWGGIVDIKRLFKDLKARVDNPLDDGWVENNRSWNEKSETEKTV